MKSIKLLLLVALGSLIASPLFAHTALKSAAPADESVLRWHWISPTTCNC
jgi:hypothetical protein